jgi:hypothetical protein
LPPWLATVVAVSTPCRPEPALHHALGAQVAGQRHVLGDDVGQSVRSGLALEGGLGFIDQDHVLHVVLS